MNHCTKEELIAFETRIKEAWEAGELKMLLHLCGGNEDQLIKIFQLIKPGDWVFSGHRSHYHYLLAGGSPVELERKIRSGDSMFVFGCIEQPMKRLDTDTGPLPPAPAPVNFLSSSVLAGTCGIAAGVAWDLNEKEGGRCRLRTDEKRGPHVWCFLGDGAEDEGHFYEAVAFVEGHSLPCTFVIEDNDRSVETSKIRRRGALGWWGILNTRIWCVRSYHYTPTYPHAGSGCKHTIVFKEDQK